MKTYQEEIKSKQWYQTFSQNTDPKEAEQQFQQKHGHKPAQSFTKYGLLWLGPVKSEK